MFHCTLYIFKYILRLPAAWVLFACWGHAWIFHLQHHISAQRNALEHLGFQIRNAYFGLRFLPLRPWWSLFLNLSLADSSSFLSRFIILLFLFTPSLPPHLRTTSWIFFISLLVFMSLSKTHLSFSWDKLFEVNASQVSMEEPTEPRPALPVSWESLVRLASSSCLHWLPRPPAFNAQCPLETKEAETPFPQGFLNLP